MKYRSLVALWLGLLSMEAIGQQMPEGSFGLNSGFVQYKFSFSSHHHFYYKYVCCTKSEEGSGTYTFKNRRLTLKFENPQNKPLPPAPETLQTDKAGDSARLDFNFVNANDSSALGNVIVSYGTQNANPYRTVSDTAGKACLIIARSHFPVTITIQYLGIDPETISIDSCSAYTINYPLNIDFERTLGSGRSLEFVVDDYDDDQIILKPIGEKEFRTFERMEEDLSAQ